MLIYLAMTFTIFEVLSLVFNQYFYDVVLFGVVFPLNVSVVFFCFGFFVLDITTEIYNNKIADQLIYGKILCQLIFVLFGKIGIMGAGLYNSQLAQIIDTTPTMIINGIIASIIGYKITTHIMQKLKIKYDGRFLMFRYIVSTLPGEIIFSLVFTILSFSKGKNVFSVTMIFLTLSLVKLILSLMFSLIVVPVARWLKYSIGDNPRQVHEYIPFI